MKLVIFYMFVFIYLSHEIEVDVGSALLSENLIESAQVIITIQ